MTPAILRLPAVLALVGLSRSTLYELVAAGQFPRQVRLSARRVGWLADEVNDWLAERRLAPLRAVQQACNRVGLPLP